MNITSKDNKEYVREFKRTGSDIKLGNRIREDIFIGFEERSFVKQNISILILLILITIGLFKIKPLFDGFKESGEIFFLVIWSLPLLILLHFLIKLVYKFIESRMENDKELISAKRIKLIGKRAVRRQNKRLDKNFRKYVYSYFYVLNNGGRNIVVRVNSKLKSHKYEKGDLVPVYLVTKRWWIFWLDELTVYYPKDEITD